jgi:hypothetical protein
VTGPVREWDWAGILATGQTVCEQCTVNTTDTDEGLAHLYAFLRDKIYRRYFAHKWNSGYRPFVNFSTRFEKPNLVFVFSIYGRYPEFKSSGVRWQDLTRPANLAPNQPNVDFIQHQTTRVHILTNSPYGGQTPTTVKRNGSTSRAATCGCKHGGYQANYPGYYNVFVNHAGACLSDYIIRLFHNDPGLDFDHFRTLFGFLIARMTEVRRKFPAENFTLDNHNEDVPILHFKYMNRRCLPPATKKNPNTKNKK